MKTTDTHTHTEPAYRLKVSNYLAKLIREAHDLEQEEEVHKPGSDGWCECAKKTQRKQLVIGAIVCDLLKDMPF